MIKAEHKYWARLIFDPYINSQLKKNFSNFYLVNEFPKAEKEKSLILTPNHISWWDGFLIDFVNKNLLKRKLFIMMLEHQLKKYWFFKKLGAYSIDPENNISIKETIKYTASISNNPKNVVVIYPQGEIEPFNPKPENIKRGLKLFINSIKNELYVLPVGFKVQFYKNKKPEVICKFGDMVDANDIKVNYDIYEKEFLYNLELLNESSFKRNFINDLFDDKK